MNRIERIKALTDAFANRIMVLDGAMGTAIQAMDLTATDFGGVEYEGCNEHLVITKPTAIAEIHASYLKSGADIIETNTFGGAPIVLAEYGLADKTFDINRLAGEIARTVAQKYSTKDHCRFVAGSMGPTTKAISVTGGISFKELTDNFYAQAKGLHAGGVDYFLIETAQDTRNVKAAILGIQRLFSEGNENIPIAISGTIEATGTMLAGQSVEAFWSSVSHLDLLYIGLNCATGPEFMTDHIRTLSELSDARVACVPNAGLPDENGKYLESPKMMTTVLERFVQSGWVNAIGGCCGTTPEHIEMFAALSHRFPPRVASQRHVSHLSGIDYVEITEEKRPVLVGERTNVIGSRKFKKLITENQFESAVEVSRGQIKNGAQVVDICLANPDRDEFEDMRRFLEQAIRMIRVPMMIDSTDASVIEMALTYSQGKSIINSINLEDGEERFAKVVPLARTFGAALVVGTIDDNPQQGMAITRERKLEVATRSYNLLTKKFGVPAQDIYWDPLVFPCGTGDAQYTGSAVETIEGLRLIKKAFPETKTVLGISNVSFGLPDSGREVLNSVFLYHCTKAGLDMAIVNAEMLERYPSISKEEREVSENLLWNRGDDPVAVFAAHFRKKRPEKESSAAILPLDDRIARYIVDGTKEGLTADLDLALKNRKPLEVINGPLMKGMDEVGRLFNNNELIVAEVLQSAEAMKAAVSYLQRFMEKADTASRGKVLLATVKGDVHDIGKNLVEIVLSNNGFEVVNLGIKVPPEVLIAAIREHNPQIVGLSGLLVKSAHQMVTTADDLTKAGVKVPMLVGGAALSRSFVDRRISKAYAGLVSYASDAMNGLELAKILVDPIKLEKFETELKKVRGNLDSNETPSIPTSQPPGLRSAIVPVSKPPTPPDFERHILTTTPNEHIWGYINPRMLLGRHLGLPNSVIRHIEEKNLNALQDTEIGKKAVELLAVVDEVKAYSKTSALLKPKAVYQFFRAQSDGENVVILDSKTDRPLATLKLPRQIKPPHLCIADYLNPVSSDVRDNLGLFIVTAGAGIREEAEALKNKGEYLRSHVLSALALETAEAYAELLHAKIRGMWGTPDPPSMTMMEKFQARYSGKRYSLGYPACPDLAEQQILFNLLKPEELGVTLTENFMMDPEASVSAIVIHHPEASYFSAA